MSNDPIHDERVLEALEARRPGSEDRSLPELGLKQLLEANPQLRVLQRRIEQADVQIGAAMHEVPVPEGLASNILAALETAREQSVSPRRFGNRGRRWFIASGLAALAASIVVAVWLGAPHAGPLDESGVLDGACRRFLSEVEADRATGRLLAESEPPEQFAMSRAVARVPELRWRDVRGLMGRQAVAFDFPGAEGRRATLYVLAGASSDIVRTRPPANPIQPTGGVSASVWREGDRLYVLVVRGDARSYRRLIYAPSGPLT